MIGMNPPLGDIKNGALSPSATSECIGYAKTICGISQVSIKHATIKSLLFQLTPQERSDWLSGRGACGAKEVVGEA